MEETLRQLHAAMVAHRQALAGAHTPPSAAESAAATIVVHDRHGSVVQQLSRDIERISGIEISGMMEAKLGRVLASVALPALEAWVTRLHHLPPDDPEWLSLIESLAVHETFFHRDQSQLDLLRRCPGIDLLLPHGAPLPDFDVHAPLANLPSLLGTTVETIPAQVPYLFADSALVDSTLKRCAAGLTAFSLCTLLIVAWLGQANRERRLALESLHANNLILAHLGHLNPVTRAMLWMGVSGVVFALLSTILRIVALQMSPLEVQFLRYFTGLTMNETATVLGLPERTLDRHWRYIRAWLMKRLS